MKPKGNRSSKKTKLSLKYNIQKRVRETKRRVKKEAKKLGLKKRVRRDPGIPNSWPFKAEMLKQLERQKAEREKELEKRKQDARAKVKEDRERDLQQRRQEQLEREQQRKEKRAAEVDRAQRETLRRILLHADVILEALDARDPLGCRCTAFEAWAKEQNKRVIFVLTKSDLVSPQEVAKWLQVLGEVGPTVAVAAEAGRDGARQLLELLGRAPAAKAAAGGSQPAGSDTPAAAGPAEPAVEPAAVPAAENVGVVGYAGTGKKALVRALRRESRGPTRWLMEATGRFRPAAPAGSQGAGEQGDQAAQSSLDGGALLHLAMRSLLTQGGKPQPLPAPAALQATEQLVARATPTAIMRRFRLPHFEGAEGLLKTFAKDRSITSKRGKEAPPETVARRLFSELGAPPGCFCTAPSGPVAEPQALWPQHGAAAPQLLAVVRAQVALLASREPGAAAGAVALASAGMGPAVDLAPVLAAGEEEQEAEVEVELSDDDEEGEEEEDGEGDEDELMEDGESEEEGDDDEDAEMG